MNTRSRNVALHALICGAGVVALLAALAKPAEAYIRLDTITQGGISEYGNMFEITASAPVNIYRLGIVTSNTNTRQVEIWHRPNGMGATPPTSPPTTGWTLVGSTSMMIPSAHTAHQIPIDVNIQINANDTHGFIVISDQFGVTYTTGTSQAANTYSDSNIAINAYGYGLRYNTGTPPPPWSMEWSPRVYNGAVWYELAQTDDVRVTLNGPSSVQNVDSDDTGSTGDGLVLADFTIETSVEPWTITEIEFAANGTGDPSTAFSELALYEDTNSSGNFDGSSVDFLATASPATAFDPTTHTYVAELDDPAWPPNTTRRFFLVGRLNGSAAPGDTFEVELTAMTASSPGPGVVDGVPTGYAERIEINPARLAVTNVPVSMQEISFDAAEHIMLEFTMRGANGDITLDSLELNAIGTGNDLEHYAEIALYLDDGSGTFDGPGTDTLLDSVTSFPSNNGLWVASLGGLTISRNTTERFFVVVTFNGQAPNGLSFGIYMPRVNVINPVATQVSGVPIGPAMMTIRTPLTVTSFDPLLAPQGTPLTIEGAGFETPVLLYIGGVQASGSAEVNSNGTLITGLTSPPGSGSNLPIELQVGTQSPELLEQTYTYGVVRVSSSGGCGTPTHTRGSLHIALWLALLVLAGCVVRQIRLRYE